MLLGKPKLSNSQLKEKIRNERFIEKNLNSIKLGTIQSFTLEILNLDVNSILVKFALDLKFANFTKAWRSAKNEMSLNKIKLEKCIKTFGKENVIATLAYSSETPPIYECLNKSIRSLITNLEKIVHTENILKKFWFFIQLMKIFSNLTSFLPLIANLNELQLKTIALHVNNNFLYRGCIVKFAAQVGEVVTLCSYTSTSTDRDVAMPFTYACGTLLKFTGVVNGVELAEMSFYPHEKEVLLFPFQTFIVTEITQNGNIIEVTLLSQTEKVVEKFSQINRLFPFKLDIHANCSYNLINILLPNSEFCFTKNIFLQLGYSTESAQNDSTKLPPCHVLSFVHRFENILNFKIDFFIPDFKTLLNCYQENKIVYIKICTVKYDINEKNATKFKIGQIILTENPLTDTQSMIELCQKHDPKGVATSFVIGKNPDKQIWNNIFKKGLEDYLHDNIKICFINETFLDLNQNAPNIFEKLAKYILYD